MTYFFKRYRRVPPAAAGTLVENQAFEADSHVAAVIFVKERLLTDMDADLDFVHLCDAHEEVIWSQGAHA